MAINLQHCSYVVFCYSCVLVFLEILSFHLTFLSEERRGHCTDYTFDIDKTIQYSNRSTYGRFYYCAYCSMFEGTGEKCGVLAKNCLATQVPILHLERVKNWFPTIPKGPTSRVAKFLGSCSLVANNLKEKWRYTHRRLHTS